ncbi:hypothetical protein ACHAXT_005217 [Thalassiosira profunda]
MVQRKARSTPQTTMASSRICLLLALLAASFTAADGALSWGSFLGADWRAGEESMRNDLSVYIQNMQRICNKNVEKLCLNGKYASTDASAYTDWTIYKRHMYKHWSDVPLGFGDAPDDCLRHEVSSYTTGTSKRLIPKCAEWMEKTQRQWDKLSQRERGNDKREAFVVFSTIFAVAVSGVVGYLLGIFLRERDDLFSYHNREENRKVLILFCVAISLPVLVILWASPRLLILMVVAFAMGRGAQYYVQKRQDNAYLSVPGGADSGLVFAAVPVQMD